MFQGSAPTVSPLDVDANLPCYTTCWEAETAAECFHQLQSVPSQPRLSTAMRQLRIKSSLESRMFEASAFGMFTLAHGLHFVLWHTTHHDLEVMLERSNECHAGARHDAELDFESRLRANFNGPAISTLASEAVAASGSDALHHFNQALDSWLYVWELRQFRDGIQEQRTFVLDPVPIYWLAKLFIVLHCHVSSIPESSEFAKPRPKDSDIGGRMHIQKKVFIWLTRLKRRERKVDREPKGSLAGLLQPID